MYLKVIDRYNDQLISAFVTPSSEYCFHMDSKIAVTTSSFGLTHVE